MTHQRRGSDQRTGHYVQPLCLPHVSVHCLVTLWFLRSTATLSLLNNVPPYSDTFTVPKDSAEELVKHAESLNKFLIESDSMGDIISLDRHQSIPPDDLLPQQHHSLVCSAIVNYQMTIRQHGLTIDAIQQNVAAIYPFVLEERADLSYDEDQLGDCSCKHHRWTG